MFQIDFAKEELQMSVNVNCQKSKISTCVPADAIELPMFFEHKPCQGASGRLCPLHFSDSMSDNKKKWIMILSQSKMNT